MSQQIRAAEPIRGPEISSIQSQRPHSLQGRIDHSCAAKPSIHSQLSSTSKAFFEASGEAAIHEMQ